MQRRFFLLTLALLAGCASELPLPSGTRSYRDELTLSGRLSVSYQRDGKPQSLQGKFHWAQQRERTAIELYSPLGQTIARIAITPERARLEQSGGEVREAASIAALTEETLGWPLPVEGLRYWLQGFARDANDRLRAVAAGEQTTLRSDGWRVNYVSWQDGGGMAVPKRIDFVRDESPRTAQGPLALRIVIDGWNEAN